MLHACRPAALSPARHRTPSVAGLFLGRAGHPLPAVSRPASTMAAGHANGGGPTHRGLYTTVAWHAAPRGYPMAAGTEPHITGRAERSTAVPSYRAPMRRRFSDSDGYK